jgi:hypothetical protein
MLPRTRCTFTFVLFIYYSCRINMSNITAQLKHYRSLTSRCLVSFYRKFGTDNRLSLTEKPCCASTLQTYEMWNLLPPCVRQSKFHLLDLPCFFFGYFSILSRNTVITVDGLVSPNCYTAACYFFSPHRWYIK